MTRSVIDLETRLPPPSQDFLRQLLHLRLLPPAALEEFLNDRTDHLPGYGTPQALARALVESGLLRPYQAQCVLGGKTHGLVMGQYRVLDRLGEGGMSTVY